MNSGTGQTIERLIATEDWSSARRAIERALTTSPDDHWLLTRLGLTCYEQRRYKRALQYAERGLALSPACPLVLWDYAGTLQMLGRHDEAIAVYRRLIRRGARRIALGRCGEGLAKARGLVADCHLRMADSYRALGDPAAADRAFATHLDLRGPGCRSSYKLGDLSKRNRWTWQRRASLNAMRRS